MSNEEEEVNLFNSKKTTRLRNNGINIKWNNENKYQRNEKEGKRNEPTNELCIYTNIRTLIKCERKKYSARTQHRQHE